MRDAARLLPVALRHPDAVREERHRPHESRGLVDFDVGLVEAATHLPYLVGILVQVRLDRQVEPPREVARALEEVLAAREGEARRHREPLTGRVPSPRQLLRLLEDARTAVGA